MVAGQVISAPSVFIAGILCMQGDQLAKKDQEKLADALQHQQLQCCPDPSLVLPVTAVVWLGAASATVTEQNKVCLPCRT
jgi:hypothetical protein